MLRALFIEKGRFVTLNAVNTCRRITYNTHPRGTTTITRELSTAPMGFDFHPSNTARTHEERHQIGTIHSTLPLLCLNGYPLGTAGLSARFPSALSTIPRLRVVFPQVVLP